MKKKYLILLLLGCLIFSFDSMAIGQKNKRARVPAKESDDIILVVTGNGPDKSSATLSALRSGIEQAFGTFVSSNTSILNDEVVKDEVVSISNGSVKYYNEISCNLMPNGEYSVTLEEMVSVGKLVAYAKSKGSSAELEGSAFVMEMRMRELNKQNEVKAILNMLRQLQDLAPLMFTRQIEVGTPKVSSGNDIYFFEQQTSNQPHGQLYTIDITVNFSENNNTGNIWNLIQNTFLSLSLTNEEFLAYHNSKIEKNRVWLTYTTPSTEYIPRNQYGHPEYKYKGGFFAQLVQDPDPKYQINFKYSGDYDFRAVLRNPYPTVESYIETLYKVIAQGINKYAICDNLGHNSNNSYSDIVFKISSVATKRNKPGALDIKPQTSTIILTEEVLGKLSKIWIE